MIVSYANYYPLTHAFIGHFDPCAGGLISARMLIKLADGAGVLLVPVGRDSQATPAALRRVVRPALERFEYLLESAAAAGAVVGECVSVDSGIAELKSLEEAAGGPAPHGPGMLGAGIGIGMPAGGIRTVSMSSAAMLHPSGLSKSTNVRYDALCALAKDSVEVVTFSNDVLAWIEADSSRREVISRHAAARASLIKKWLKGAGELLDPLLIAGNPPPGQDAGGLLSIVLAARASSRAAVGADGSTGVMSASAISLSILVGSQWWCIPLLQILPRCLKLNGEKGHRCNRMQVPCRTRPPPCRGCS